MPLVTFTATAITAIEKERSSLLISHIPFVQNMLRINEIGNNFSNKERRIHKLFESGLPNW